MLKRDNYRCTHRDQYGDRCTEDATDVDHVLRGDDHRESNLASLCAYHHRKKSSAEGGDARAAALRKHARKFSRAEKHPGLL